MSEPPPESPTQAARVLIGWFAGGLAFQCTDTLHSGPWPSLGYGVGAIVVAIIDYKLKAILAGSPRLTKSLNGVASDARWWVGIGIASLVVISLSPYIQQQKWPTVPFFRLTGSQAELTVTRGNPEIGKAVANAIAPLQAQLDAANKRVQQLESAIRNAPPPPPPNYDEPRVYTKKSLAELRALYDGRTPAQGDIFMADEGGKWLETDGTVDNVLSDGRLLLTKDEKGLECFFDRTWQTKLTVLRKNDHVKITGKLRAHQNPYLITLDNCELDD